VTLTGYWFGCIRILDQVNQEQFGCRLVPCLHAALDMMHSANRRILYIENKLIEKFFNTQANKDARKFRIESVRYPSGGSAYFEPPTHGSRSSACSFVHFWGISFCYFNVWFAGFFAGFLTVHQNYHFALQYMMSIYAADIWESDDADEAQDLWKAMVLLRDWLFFHYSHNVLDVFQRIQFKHLTIALNHAMADAFGDTAITALMHITEHVDVVAQQFGSLKLVSVWAEVGFDEMNFQSALFLHSFNPCALHSFINFIFVHQLQERFNGFFKKIPKNNRPAGLGSTFFYRVRSRMKLFAGKRYSRF
jgi:hypothetical protein